MLQHVGELIHWLRGDHGAGQQRASIFARKECDGTLGHAIATLAPIFGINSDVIVRLAPQRRRTPRSPGGARWQARRRAQQCHAKESPERHPHMQA
eukprot:6635573-Pyramimonas_sp.AAC.1